MSLDPAQVHQRHPSAEVVQVVTCWRDTCLIKGQRKLPRDWTPWLIGLSSSRRRVKLCKAPCSTLCSADSNNSQANRRWQGLQGSTASKARCGELEVDSSVGNGCNLC